ncbi:tRNA pseudouridine(38-40) synthase TruA [Rothia sp. P13129]|uniref:tRNA pseudouridine(38-40) synthase TruA n=1 Tax=unclassified Rothia (in: high G+C Gram-positive bacteria) TaxID=2689056 RepID=UPI003ACD829C
MDTVEHHNQRVRIDLAYDGTPFAGWAKQPGLVTVEGCLEQALEMVLRAPVRLVVGGRTDAGVHATHQVVHCDIERSRWDALPGRSDSLPADALKRRLRGVLGRVLTHAERELGLPSRFNGFLNGSIRILAVSATCHTFDARFSATGRSYRYLIDDGSNYSGESALYRRLAWQVDQPLDLELMNDACEVLLGLHDFLSFCKPREGATTIRQLRELSFYRTEQGLIRADIRADAFCHHMVRSLIAAAVSVGSGTHNSEWLGDRIKNPLRDSQIRLAPPWGLALSEITYPEESAFEMQARQARSRREL